MSRTSLSDNVVDVENSLMSCHHFWVTPPSYADYESGSNMTYRKIPIITAGLTFVQKAVLLGLSLEGFIIGTNFAFQNGLGLTIKTA